LRNSQSSAAYQLVHASHANLGDRWLYATADASLLFTENETNNQRLFGGQNASAYVKDGINDCIIGGRRDAVNSSAGTKVAAYERFTVKSKESVSTISTAASQEL
jgi:hypothetical protein